jgi:uncharacterized protein (DUF1800 family)
VSFYGGFHALKNCHADSFISLSSFRLFAVNVSSPRVDIALKSKDQFRQRVAFVLAQILAISPDAVPNQDYTEAFLSYYDIFVRNAFGNYFDVLKEVSYHPLMSFMLTYHGGLSTAYALVTRGLHQSADENFAREM